MAATQAPQVPRLERKALSVSPTAPRTTASSTRPRRTRRASPTSRDDHHAAGDEAPPGAPGGAQPLRRDDDRERDQDEGHDRQDDPEHAQLLAPVRRSAPGVAGRPLPTWISPRAPSMRWASSGLTTAIASTARSTPSWTWITRSRRLARDDPRVEGADRPAERLLEALARHDPVHHRAHQRLGALGVGAATGDQVGGKGVGEVLLDVLSGERRLRAALELAGVEQLAPDIEHDRRKDDRQDRQAEQDAGGDAAPARSRRARVTGSAGRSWLRHPRGLGARAQPATLIAPSASTTAPAVSGGGRPGARCAVRPFAIPSSRPPLVVADRSDATSALRSARGRGALRPPRP